MREVTFEGDGHTRERSSFAFGELGVWVLGQFNRRTAGLTRGPVGIGGVGVNSKYTSTGTGGTMETAFSVEEKNIAQKNLSFLGKKS